jgi:hypothetical protein
MKSLYAAAIRKCLRFLLNAAGSGEEGNPKALARGPAFTLVFGLV